MLSFIEITLILYLIGFIASTIEMLLNPVAYKAKELLLFSKHKILGIFDKVLFSIAAASTAFLLLHFFFEPFALEYLLLYVIVVLTSASFVAFYFSRSVANYMYAKTRKKTKTHYYTTVAMRIAISILLIIMPLVM